MREDLRIIVVDNPLELPRPRVRPRALDGLEGLEMERTGSLPQAESPSVTCLVEWFQTLAGAEWQWT